MMKTGKPMASRRAERVAALLVFLFLLGFIGYLLFKGAPVVALEVSSGSSVAEIRSIEYVDKEGYVLRYQFKNQFNGKTYNRRRRRLGQRQVERLREKKTMVVHYPQGFPEYVVIEELDHPMPAPLIVLVWMLSLLGLYPLVQVLIGEKTLGEVFGAKKG